MTVETALTPRTLLSVPVLYQRWSRSSGTLTDSFGGAAKANVITGRFLAGEYIYQGESLEQATAVGYVSETMVGRKAQNSEDVDYTGDFVSGQNVTGTISKASGTIDNLSIAKGVLKLVLLLLRLVDSLTTLVSRNPSRRSKTPTSTKTSPTVLELLLLSLTGETSLPPTTPCWFQGIR